MTFRSPTVFGLTFPAMLVGGSSGGSSSGGACLETRRRNLVARKPLGAIESQEWGGGDGDINVGQENPKRGEGLRYQCGAIESEEREGGQRGT